MFPSVFGTSVDSDACCPQFVIASLSYTKARDRRATDNPPNMKVCPRGTWNERMAIETTFSMLTLICHLKKVAHRVWRYFTMRLGFTLALFNVLVQWDGLPRDERGRRFGQ